MEDDEGLAIISDDFDLFLDFMEDTEDIEQHFEEATTEVQAGRMSCDLCSKTFKSKGGLKRHKTVKHRNQEADGESTNEHQFTADTLDTLVKEAKGKLVSSRLYPKSTRDELGSYNFITLTEHSTEFIQIQRMYLVLLRNGNAEKFFSNFYATIARNASQYFEGLSRKTATLLSTKVADQMLVHSQEKQTAKVQATREALSQKETAGLQYLGGYVLHKLHNKMVNCKHRESPEIQQAISLLRAGKGDSSPKSNQKLIGCLNRGGLWTITASAQKLFMRVEHVFRTYTTKPVLLSIDITGIIGESLCDCEAVAAFNNMSSESELVISKTVSKDLFHSIVRLYVRVRSFSFAKDVVQTFKLKGKHDKTKALRKEIKRAVVDHESKRQS